MTNDASFCEGAQIEGGLQKESRERETLTLKEREREKEERNKRVTGKLHTLKGERELNGKREKGEL